MTACDGVLELVSKREQETAEARKQLDDLRSMLDHITTKLPRTY
jgi:hypothetical protein